MLLTRDYYEIVNVDSVNEFDFLSSNISKFKNYIIRTPSYVTFKAEYVGRLDLASYDLYGTPYLWWVIALSNDIIDPFDSSIVNTLLQIPDILDVYDFYDANYISTEGY